MSRYSFHSLGNRVGLIGNRTKTKILKGSTSLQNSKRTKVDKRELEIFKDMMEVEEHCVRLILTATEKFDTQNRQDPEGGESEDISRRGGEFEDAPLKGFISVDNYFHGLISI